MWVGPVDLPDHLLEAQENGDLVIFAGAGISIGKPSNLPNFEELAEKIAHRSLEENEKKHIDVFLGTLVNKGQRVHEGAVEILTQADSKPTNLHRFLVELVCTMRKPRIVTTNFDDHFSVAAKEECSSLETYYAPALPLGNDFSGLVYLHGSVNKPPERLVLTDVDFGRAYLTEGWATRFLMDLFLSYTVLFVGYSHNDPVMKYLARGLPINRRPRYAFTSSDEDREWNNLGIKPIQYPTDRDRTDHIELEKTIESWKRLSQLRVIDHELRIKQIVSGDTELLDKESSDYLGYCLKKPYTTRFFTRYARTEFWLKWVENHKAFDVLFSVSPDLDEVSKLLAEWFASNYLNKNSGVALEMISRKGPYINHFLWNSIVHSLAFAESKPESDIYARWVMVLLESASPNCRIKDLGYLFKNCSYIGNYFVIIALFEYLTRPSLKLETNLFRNFPEQFAVEGKLELYGESHSLCIAWKNLLKPNLAEYYQKIEEIIRSQIENGYLKLQAFGPRNEKYDRINISRKAIEDHQQNHRHTGIDFLIDAARDLVEYAVNLDENLAKEVLGKWANTKAPISKRIYIHAITENAFCSADEKILTLLRKEWLFSIGMKYESFRLLKRSYAGAGDEVRKKLVDYILDASHAEALSGSVQIQIGCYDRFNALVWLSRIDPNCLVVKSGLSVIQEAHPEFKPREYPELDIYSTWMTGTQSPMTADDLLAIEPQDKLQLLIDFRETNSSDPSRAGLLKTLSVACSRNYGWSYSLVKLLANERNWLTDLWEFIFQGWRQGRYDIFIWNQIFDFILVNRDLYRWNQAIAELLSSFIESEKNNQLAIDSLELAEKLSFEIFQSESDENRNDDFDQNDKYWLSRAINHVGGKLALFWLEVLSLRRSHDNEWSGIPSTYLSIFETILKSVEKPSVMARIVMCSQIHFLYSLDEILAKKVCALFDPRNDPTQAEQAWHGFVFLGRWNEAFLPELLENGLEFTPQLVHQSEEIRRRFCDFLADVALYSSIHPLEQRWLTRFIAQADLQSREFWAEAFVKQILTESGSCDHIVALWDSWIREYWSRRINGDPIPLSEEEKEIMVTWAIALEPVFPEAVKLVIATPSSKMDIHRLLRKLIKKDLTTKYPVCVAQLLAHLLPNQNSFNDFGEVECILNGLFGCSECKTSLLSICDSLAQLGFSKAIEWNNMVSIMPDIN